MREHGDRILQKTLGQFDATSRSVMKEKFYLDIAFKHYTFNYMQRLIRLASIDGTSEDLKKMRAVLAQHTYYHVFKNRKRIVTS